MTSRRIIRFYQAMVYWSKGLQNATSCLKAEEHGITYTEEERAKMHEASRLFYKAKEIVNEVMAKRIGDAVAFDVRTGDYKP